MISSNLLEKQIYNNLFISGKASNICVPCSQISGYIVWQN